MTSRTRTADTNDAPPALRLAAHVEAAVAELRRGIKEAATPPRELSDDELQVALAVDDLHTNLSDLELLARDLRREGAK